MVLANQFGKERMKRLILEADLKTEISHLSHHNIRNLRYQWLVLADPNSNGSQFFINLKNNKDNSVADYQAILILKKIIEAYYVKGESL